MVILGSLDIVMAKSIGEETISFDSPVALRARVSRYLTRRGNNHFV